VRSRKIDNQPLAAVLQLLAELADQVAVGREAAFQAVNKVVPAGEVTGPLPQRENEPVRSGFVELLQVTSQVELVHDSVEIGGSFLRRGAFRSDEIVGHHAEGPSGHPGGPVGRAVGLPGFDRRRGQRRHSDQPEEEPWKN